MKIDSLDLLLNKNILLDKKFFFVGGNEPTLMEKICDIILTRYKENDSAAISKIDTIDDFVEDGGLFERDYLYICKNCKGLNEKNLSRIKNQTGSFVFVQENSKKTNSVKKFFLNDKDSFLIDCYELKRDSKIKIINNFLKTNNINIKEDIFWSIVEKTDNRYFFLENSLEKINSLDTKDITVENINKLLEINLSGKEKIFFHLLKKNNEIIKVYKDKIQSDSDANELYYLCRYFCQMIIDSNSADEYSKKIPIYLFMEKKFLISLFNRYSQKKKKLLLRLLSNTELALRKKSDLSIIFGLRFLLSIKKITVS